jgi:hypothetical protein
MQSQITYLGDTAILNNWRKMLAAYISSNNAGLQILTLQKLFWF